MDLIPPSIKTQIEPYLKYKDLLLAVLDNSTEYAVMASSIVNTVIAVLPPFVEEIAKLANISSTVITQGLGLLNQVAPMLNDVVKCMGAPTDCKAIVQFIGMGLEYALPLIKEQVPTGFGWLVSGYFNKFEELAKKMKTGDFSALGETIKEIEAIDYRLSWLPFTGGIRGQIKMPLALLKAMEKNIKDCEAKKNLKATSLAMTSPATPLMIHSVTYPIIYPLDTDTIPATFEVGLDGLPLTL
ncbi:hypothetical protein BGZ83_004271 [Gryganskiella cystojenkinii]|nr:hypothetical protein BGZ83_004271 [Gryganskiella cystojenkinii]